MDKREIDLTNKIGYRDIFAQKEFLKITIANIISRFGDSIDAIAFTWLVYSVTGSASWSAIIYAANLLPTIIVQPLAGPLAEKLNQKMLLILSDITRGTMVIILAVCYLTNTINPALLLSFTLIISLAEAFALPADAALLPKVLDKKYYEFGLSFRALSTIVMQLAGTAAAGIIIGIFGIGAAILVDAVTFGLSALITAFIKIPVTNKEFPKKENVPVNKYKVYISDLKEGFSYIGSNILLRNYCILAALINAIFVPINSLLGPFVSDVLGQGSELLSAIGISFMIGTGIGSFLFPYMAEKLSVKRMTIYGGWGISVLYACLTAGNFFKEKVLLVYAITGICCILFGLLVSLLSASLSVSFVKSVSPDHMARAHSIMNAGCLAVSPVTSLLISGLVIFIPVREIYWVCSIICAIMFAMVGLLKVKLETEE